MKLPFCCLILTTRVPSGHFIHLHMKDSRGPFTSHCLIWGFSSNFLISGHLLREGMLTSIKVFTESITPSSNCLAATETLLSNTRTTDMKPHMIRAMRPLEVLTIFGICRYEISLLVLEEFCYHGCGLSLHIPLYKVFNETLKLIILNFIPRLGIRERAFLNDG